MNPAPDPSHRSGEYRPCVLVLDSDRRVAEALGLAIRSRARVEWAAGGVSGLIAFVERKPDLVLVDGQLPDVASGELLRLLRILRPCLPIALLSEPKPTGGAGEPEEPGLLPKPVDLKRCLAWIFDRLEPRPAARPESVLDQLPVDAPLHHLEIVQWVLEFIEERFRDGTSLTDLARTVGVSRSHLCRIFRRVTGHSLKSFLTRRRLLAAKTMLQDPTVMIQRVAAAVGYRDLSHFDRVFRRLEGQSPSSYRRRHIEEPRSRGSRQKISSTPHCSAPALA
ncbi:MAG TPA: DNA-binding response regulator [Candidatus Methylomirabilis sp.]|nr:DNA-binding response regulator [Candidatus Methylomirabilis sp.]